MERTVPRTASEEVELYTRTYYSLLRSTANVQIRTLEEAHAGMRSLLHPGARDLQPDMSAFIYCLLRLPECMPEVRLVLLGQSTDTFTRAGLDNVESWEQVFSPARRRLCFFNGKDTLACYIASRTDIDDTIPMLTAYQIEWNKLHRLLANLPPGTLREAYEKDSLSLQELADILEMSLDDLGRLAAVWGEAFSTRLQQIAARECRLSVRLLSSSYREYRRATLSWWENVERALPDLRTRPVYFVSSNTHSVINLLSGFAIQHQKELVQFLECPENAGLLQEWQDILARNVPSSQENFLYYVLKKYIQGNSQELAHRLADEQAQHERDLGIVRIPSRHSFEVEAQVIDLARLDPEKLDPRLRKEILATGLASRLASSDALILNIDYPLGLAAYNILSEVSESINTVLGVYVMGKSATLNAVIGDVVIPNVVQDEQTQNTFLFQNCFSAADVAPYLVHGSVLDNQKAVSVQGTFLQNAHYMDVFYREGFTDIEMESGPYLSAVYEMVRPKRHPVNEIVSLYGLPFDLGIIHYSSDTPLSKGRNLGAGSLSYYGIDSSYAVTLAILQRILKLESSRV